MVVDVGRFQPGQPLPAGLLTLVEQTPGRMYWRDVTERLEDG